MTDDFLSRAMREYERVRPCDTVKVSLEARLDRLEAESSLEARLDRLEAELKRDFNRVCFVAGAVFAALVIERLFL